MYRGGDLERPDRRGAGRTATYPRHMAQQLSIVMYHYIRDFARSRYPRLK